MKSRPSLSTSSLSAALPSPPARKWSRVDDKLLQNDPKPGRGRKGSDKALDDDPVLGALRRIGKIDRERNKFLEEEYGGIVHGFSVSGCMG